MSIILLIILCVAGMTLFKSLMAIIKPINSTGLKTRKEAAQTALGSFILCCILTTIYLYIAGNTEQKVALNAQEKSKQSNLNPKTTKIKEETIIRITDFTWREEATNAILNEPKVIEAMFPNNSTTSFWVSMFDDGTKRDGFAQYVCLVLIDHEMPQGKMIVIRIWDAVKLVNGEFHELGQYICEN